MEYSKQDVSSSQVSVIPMTENLMLKSCKSFSKFCKFAFKLRIFIWHMEKYSSSQENELILSFKLSSL